jgi:hypothetical protein
MTHETKEIGPGWVVPPKIIKHADRIAELAHIAEYCDEKDERMAHQIRKHMFYLVGQMEEWKGLTPETIARLKQISNSFFPSLDELVRQGKLKYDIMKPRKPSTSNTRTHGEAT